MRMAIASIFMAASLSAQSGGFGAPQLAVIYRAGTGTLHPVGGVAAANRTGRAIGGVPKLEQAVVAHDGGFALGVSDQGKVVLARLSNGRAQEVGEISGVDSPHGIVLSPRSQSAAIRNGSTITVLANLRGDVGRRTVALEVAPTLLAIDDTGDWIAFDAADRGIATVRNTQTGASVEVPLSGITALQFVAGSEDLLTADGSRYYVVRSGVPTILSSASDGAQPTAAASGADARFYFLADNAGHIQRVDAHDLSTSTFDCGCSPDRLRPANGPARFQIGKIDSRLVYLEWGDSPSLFSITEVEQ